MNLLTKFNPANQPTQDEIDTLYKLYVAQCNDPCHYAYGNKPLSKEDYVKADPPEQYVLPYRKYLNSLLGVSIAKGVVLPILTFENYLLQKEQSTRNNSDVLLQKHAVQPTFAIQPTEEQLDAMYQAYLNRIEDKVNASPETLRIMDKEEYLKFIQPAELLRYYQEYLNSWSTHNDITGKNHPILTFEQYINQPEKPKNFVINVNMETNASQKPPEAPSMLESYRTKSNDGPDTETFADYRKKMLNQYFSESWDKLMKAVESMYPAHLPFSGFKPEEKCCLYETYTQLGKTFMETTNIALKQEDFESFKDYTLTLLEKELQKRQRKNMAGTDTATAGTSNDVNNSILNLRDPVKAYFAKSWERMLDALDQLAPSDGILHELTDEEQSNLYYAYVKENETFMKTTNIASSVMQKGTFLSHVLPRLKSDLHKRRVRNESALTNKSLDIDPVCDEYATRRKALVTPVATTSPGDLTDIGNVHIATQEEIDALNLLTKSNFKKEPDMAPQFSKENQEPEMDLDNKTVSIGKGPEMFKGHMFKDGVLCALPNPIVGPYIEKVKNWRFKMSFFTVGEHGTRDAYDFHPGLIVSDGSLVSLSRIIDVDILRDKGQLADFMVNLAKLDFDGMDVDVAAGRSYLQNYDVKSLQVFVLRAQHFKGTLQEKEEGLCFATTLYRLASKLQQNEQYIDGEKFEEPDHLGYSATAKEKFLHDLKARVLWLLDNLDNLARHARYLQEDLTEIELNKHRVILAYKELNKERAAFVNRGPKN